MRTALRQNPARRQVSRTASVPAPILGWNTVDGLQSLKPGYAVVLDNWIPRAGGCEMRRGYVEQSTGSDDPVETLVVYRGTPAGDQLFACHGEFITDVTTSGAMPSADYASAESARWNYTNFANDAGRYAILANGAQDPIKYDGSTFSANAITGTSGSITLDDADLKYVFSHKRRLHFIEKETLRVWFLSTNAIAGASQLLDLGPVFDKGGYLVGGGRLTLDGGVGPDDFAFYLTNEGQVALYQGIDPSDANNWSLVGVYNLPRPIGDRCILDYGTDAVIVTEGGILPLTAALRSPDGDDFGKIALSRRINATIANSAGSYGDQFGWQPILYPGRGGLLILNSPTEELTTSVQYVRSSESGGWARFTGINAFCWGFANGMIFFGSTEGVYRWDVGASDNSEPIVADVLPAFSDFGNRTQNKNFTMVRALMRCPAIVRPALQVVTDYDLATIPTAIQNTVSPGDISTDDTVLIREAWTGAAGIGYEGAPRMRINLVGADDVDVVAVNESHSELLLVGPGGSDNVLTRPNLPLDVQVELVGFDMVFQAGGVL